MSDPQRLIVEGADDFEAELLRAGRKDAPSDRSRGRVLAGLGLGSLLSASMVASGAKATSNGWLSASALGALRWVGGGAVSALAVWAGVHAAAPAPVPAKGAQQSLPKAVVTASAKPAVSAPAPTTPLDAEDKAPASKPSAPQTQRAAAAPERAQDTLSSELSALDGARSALQDHDSSLSLRLLDDYARRFPKPRLATEAVVLRIEALTARGDHASAARLGKEFLARHPNGPYARRVSSLVSGSAPSAKAER